VLVTFAVLCCLCSLLSPLSLQVVHYKDNQRYDPHTDWGVQGHPESRFITLLMFVTVE
jgi:hypothetical protein